MAKAFECWNNSNYYQIDSLYPNLRLVTKGTVYCGTRIPNDQNAPQKVRYIADIAVDASSPIVAYRCDEYCGSVGVGFNGSQYVHRFYRLGQGNVDYWVYADRPVNVSAGLEVYNEQGTLVFTSADRPAKVAGNFEPPDQTLYSEREYQFGGIRKLALIQNSPNQGSLPSQNYAVTTAVHSRVRDSARVGVIYDQISVIPPKRVLTAYPRWANYTLLDVYGQ